MTQAANSETFEAFKRSFSYGTRNDLNFKFFKSLGDEEVAAFLELLLERLGDAYDTGEIQPLIDAAYEAQIAGYSPDPDAAPRPHTYATGPFSTTAMPVAGSTVGLITSSGHFVRGDDPEPLGVKDMTQEEAIDRIDEFLKEAPELSEIPSTTPGDQLVVRHGGYDVTSAARDPNVAFPIDRLAQAQASGRIGGTTSTYFSFPGATAQGRLRRELPTWLDRFAEESADVFLLVPV